MNERLIDLYIEKHINEFPLLFDQKLGKELRCQMCNGLHGNNTLCQMPMEGYHEIY